MTVQIRTEERGFSLPVAVAPGLAFPSDGVRVIASGTPHGQDVEVLVVVQDGRLVAREVVVRQVDDGPPVTSEALRQVQVAALVQWAVRHIQRVHAVREHQIVLDAGLAHEAEFTRAKQQGMTDETLQLVARIYRVALLMGKPPVKIIEEWFELPRSTAGRWVTAARKKGFLEPAAGPGKPGGSVASADSRQAVNNSRADAADDAKLDTLIEKAHETYRREHGER